MKTIAYLTPLYFGDESYVGGGERYPLNLAIGVAESSDGEFEVEILSYGPRPLRRQLHPGVRLRVMQADYNPPNKLDTVSWELPEALAAADVIHLMQCFTRGAEVGIVLGKMLNKPLCATDLGGPSSLLGGQLRTLDLVDRVVCYSDFGADILRTKSPIVTIKGGVDGRLFTPPTPRPYRDRVLYVGRLLPHKGIDVLIEALPPDVPLTCCGRPYHADYFARLQRLAEGKRVEFITDASDAVIRELYGRAWVNVLPSQYKDCYGQTYLAPELMGLTLLEAMACGTPVICSRVGAMPEFVRDGETGFVFDSVPHLTELLRRFAGDPTLADRMGARARRAVDVSFDLRVCGAKLADVYRELTAAPDGGGDAGGRGEGGGVKILVISNLYPPDVLGGYEMGCKQAVDALRAAGHEVLVLVGQPRSMGVPPDPAVRRSLRLVDVYDPYYEWKARPHVTRIRHHEACAVQAGNVHALAEAVGEFRPDVAYVWNIIGLGGLGLMAALQHLGVPWVMHLMDDVPLRLCGPTYGAPVTPVVGATLARLARGRFVSCSNTTLAEVVAGGVDIAARTTVIPNWVVVTGGGDRTDYLPGGRLRVIQTGAVSTAKGVDITIRAAALLRDRGVTNLQVDVYGPGIDPYFPNLVQSLGVQDIVGLKGPRTQAELYALYPQYDAFCFPTWAREPFAFAPMEAMAFGCLGVISRACGVSECFLDGLECVKCDRSPEAFADALGRVAAGHVPLAEVGRRAAHLIRREYRIEVIMPRVVAVLEEAVRAGGGPARPAAEAVHVALLAEKTFQCLINEAAA